METISYSETRGNFRKTLDKVCEDHIHVIVTRQNKPPVVMMSLEDYHAIEETLHLMRHPRNAARLMRSVSNIEKKKYKKHSLADA